MRFIAAVVMLLVSGLALAATVYKWVDENGVTHYSDQPHPGAQKVTVAAPQTYSAPPPPAVAPAVKASTVSNIETVWQENLNVRKRWLGKFVAQGALGVDAVA